MNRYKKSKTVEVDNEIFDELDNLANRYDIKKRRLVSDLLKLGLKHSNVEELYKIREI
jgi:hypothetical protein